MLIVIPYRLAFVKFEDDEYDSTFEIFDICIDSFFGVDIILNFFTAYTDKDEVEYDGICQIAKNYLKFWFWLDLLSIFPFE